MGRSTGAARRERGAAAIEFGLVSVLLITLLLGIIQFSFWFWSWQSGAYAARSAARVAAVSPCDTAAIQSAGQRALGQTPGGSTADITVTRPGVMLVGDEMSVRIRFTTVDLHFFPGFTGRVDKSATVRVENVPAGGC